VIVSSFKRNNGPRAGSKGGGFTAKMHIKIFVKGSENFLAQPLIKGREKSGGIHSNDDGHLPAA